MALLDALPKLIIDTQEFVTRRMVKGSLGTAFQYDIWSPNGKLFLYHNSVTNVHTITIDEEEPQEIEEGIVELYRVRCEFRIMDIKRSVVVNDYDPSVFDQDIVNGNNHQ